MLFIYTTSTDIEKARELSEVLIQKKWATAVNFWPTHSVYASHGAPKEGEGVILFIRTLEKHLQDIEDYITASHLGGIPCVASLNVYRINRPYKEQVMAHIN